MPSLRELEAYFLKYTKENDTTIYVKVDTLQEAQGVEFLCPKCFINNHGRVGTHSVLCWFADRGVPDDAEPLPGRWTPQGTGLDDLTFIPTEKRSHSVLLTSGCNWHGFIKNGHAD